MEKRDHVLRSVRPQQSRRFAACERFVVEILSRTTVRRTGGGCTLDFQPERRPREQSSLERTQSALMGFERPISCTEADPFGGEGVTTEGVHNLKSHITSPVRKGLCMLTR